MKTILFLISMIMVSMSYSIEPFVIQEQSECFEFVQADLQLDNIIITDIDLANETILNRNLRNQATKEMENFEIWIYKSNLTIQQKEECLNYQNYDGFNDLSGEIIFISTESVLCEQDLYIAVCSQNNTNNLSLTKYLIANNSDVHDLQFAPLKYPCFHDSYLS